MQKLARDAENDDEYNIGVEMCVDGCHPHELELRGKIIDGGGFEFLRFQVRGEVLQSRAT